MGDETNTIKPEDSAGVLGDGALHAGKANMALVRRALREDWPISKELRSKLVDQMGKIVESPDSARDCIAAAKVLVAADSINAKRESVDAASERNSDPQTIVNVGVSVQHSLQAMDAREQEYVEWRNERALRRRVDPSLVGCNGFTEQILGPAPSADTQSGGDANN